LFSELRPLTRIVAQIRARWPRVKIVIGGDSGFCREDIMAWCEAQGVHFLLGLAKNNRLIKRIGDALHSAECAYHLSGQASRVFEDFSYRTVKSWSQARRVVAKAERLSKGANPRFVVTSLPAERYGARTLYEDHNSARGDRKNRHQGATARPVRRPHHHPHLTRQPDPPVLRLLRLCPALRPAPARPPRHRAGPAPNAAPFA